MQHITVRRSSPSSRMCIHAHYPEVPAGAPRQAVAVEHPTHDGFWDARHALASPRSTFCLISAPTGPGVPPGPALDLHRLAGAPPQPGTSGWRCCHPAASPGPGTPDAPQVLACATTGLGGLDTASSRRPADPLSSARHRRLADVRVLAAAGGDGHALRTPRRRRTGREARPAPARISTSPADPVCRATPTCRNCHLRSPGRRRRSPPTSSSPATSSSPSKRRSPRPTPADRRPLRRRRPASPCRSALAGCGPRFPRSMTLSVPGVWVLRAGRRWRSARQRVAYWIPVVPNARRLPAGHRLRLVIASADEMASGRRSLASTGVVVREASCNTVFSASRCGHHSPGAMPLFITDLEDDRPSGRGPQTAPPRSPGPALRGYRSGLSPPPGPASKPAPCATKRPRSHSARPLLAMNTEGGSVRARGLARAPVVHALQRPDHRVRGRPRHGGAGSRAFAPRHRSGRMEKAADIT